MDLGIIIIVLFVLGLIAIGVLGYVIAVFNGLVRLKNNIKKSWANIDVLLKQRSDELPKLIESVKGYMKHEKGTLTELTKARTAFMKATSMSGKAKADNMLTGALKSLFAVAENYPDLKANQNFIQLQDRISSIESELADRREFYNDSANTYNIRIQVFPDVIVARMLGYTEQEMFKVSEADKQDVEVKF